MQKETRINDDGGAPASPSADYGLKVGDGFDPSSKGVNKVGLSPIQENDAFLDAASNDIDRVSKIDLSGQEQGQHHSLRQDETSSERSNEQASGIEKLASFLFSRQHLAFVLRDKDLLLKFRLFLTTQRPHSLSRLKCFDRLTKALRCLEYAEAIVRDLKTDNPDQSLVGLGSISMPWLVQDKLELVLDSLVQDDFRNFVIGYYSHEIEQALTAQVSGKRNTSAKILGNVAEVFVLSDPARSDNPIIFTSEGFQQMTGYQRDEVLGHNCRFLNGQRTCKLGRGRFRSAIDGGKQHCELLLNYSVKASDASQMQNFVLDCIADRVSGNVRYFLGAQFDATSLLHSKRTLPTVQDFLDNQGGVQRTDSQADAKVEDSEKVAFENFLNALDADDIENTRSSLMSSQQIIGSTGGASQGHTALHNDSRGFEKGTTFSDSIPAPPALGFYSHVIFTSQDLGNLNLVQAPLLSLIGASTRILQALVQALEAGRKVTAKVKWLRSNQRISEVCWIHCTPLLGPGDVVGVWAIILVDAEEGGSDSAPPTSPYAQESSGSPSQPFNSAPALPWESVDAISSESANSEPIDSAERNPYRARPSLQTLQRQSATQSRPRSGDAQLSDSSQYEDRPRAKQTISASREASTSSVRTEMGPKLRAPGSPLADGLEFQKFDIQSNKSNNGVKAASGIPTRKTYKSLSPYGVLFKD
ncbi:uncharacterized protein KY384_002193 [Bacidia gigantensis]|uniref:uncharacterized protein n=1 Tax=Bacidia gigantensis TaxID=2732470 RepID=UPI001D03C753|nr:uncharacterized protein KY384_002193 [Bacidia gigantensis]KAG8533410.1 hypothetical protein KY384_002193 [Bacidia gigantensis]